MVKTCLHTRVERRGDEVFVREVFDDGSWVESTFVLGTARAFARCLGEAAADSAKDGDFWGFGRAQVG